MTIPDYIEYAKLSESGDYVYGSIQDEELIKEVCEKGKVNQLRFMNGTTYELIGNSSEKWILGYKSATSQFSNNFEEYFSECRLNNYYLFSSHGNHRLFSDFKTI